MSDYAWVITRDLVAEEEFSKQLDSDEPVPQGVEFDAKSPFESVGISGPFNVTTEDVDRAMGSKSVFRMLDDDGTPMCWGKLSDPSGDNEFAPLDDFGRGMWGCTEIEYWDYEKHCWVAL